MKIPAKKSELMQARFVYAFDKPDERESTVAVLERDEDADGNTDIAATKQQIDQLSRTVEEAFTGLRKKIEESGMPGDKKKEYLDKIAEMEQSAMENQIKLVNKLGNKLKSQISTGKLYEGAMKDLQSALEGTEAQAISSQIKEKKLKIGTRRVTRGVVDITVSTAEGALEIAGKVIGSAVGNVLLVLYHIGSTIAAGVAKK